eukprot:5324317-Prymnesium_polylepis.1
MARAVCRAPGQGVAPREAISPKCGVRHPWSASKAQTPAAVGEGCAPPRASAACARLAHTFPRPRHPRGTHAFDSRTLLLRTLSPGSDAHTHLPGRMCGQQYSLPVAADAAASPKRVAQALGSDKRSSTAAQLANAERKRPRSPSNKVDEFRDRDGIDGDGASCVAGALG